MRRQKRESCTNSDCKKMANLGDKSKFRQKWRAYQKFIKGLAEYSNEVTKRGILTNGDFYKNDKFAENNDFGKK